MLQAALAQVIGAIGEHSFAASAAGALRRAIDFDLAAVVLHRSDARAELLFDDFGPAGHAQGIRNYVGFTHRMNPMLGALRGAVRASDFALAPDWRGRDVPERYLVWTADEEMGFRTLGWPERCEEIGLYFAAREGIVELSFYRERGRAVLSEEDLQALGALSLPVAAAFDRHAALRRSEPALDRLSTRECEVYDLLVAGCSSEAIALRLGISRHTVKDHRKQIFRKLHIGSLAELFAASRGAN